MMLLLYAFLCQSVLGITFVVPESSPIGHVIGYIEGRPTLATTAKYFVVYPDTASEQIIKIDEKSGEITLIAQLDYEKHKKFEILAVPIDGGEGVQATIEVEDVNDHLPTFPEEKIKLEISEFARIGAAYPLPRAEDADGPDLTVQKYRIAQGNVNNVFKVATRPVNHVLYADLVVNGQLDREYRDKYELIIEAIDGGTPAKIGRLRVNIVILDANDNAPVFAKPRYSIAVPANLTVGSQVLNLKATDADVGDNGKVAFRFQKTKIDSLSLFSLSSTGVLSTAAHLFPGTVHDLVVVAYDGGTPSLETTAIITVTVQGTSLTAPAVDIIWLTDTATAHLLENVTVGMVVARLSLNEEQKDSTVTLAGCSSLCLRQSQSPTVYLLLVCSLFDRESSPEYHLKFSLRRDKELVLEHPVLLTIGDVNDNAPTWPHSHIHITLNRSISISDQTTTLTASDPDQGINGRIRYSIVDSDIIAVDPDTGRLTPLKDLDCALGQQIRFKVRAMDGGVPSLYSDLQVTADLVDGYGRPPLFEKSLYEVEISEESEIGTCLLKVKATNSLCGGSSRLRYAFQESGDAGKLFNIDSTSGTICLERKLDFEQETSHQLSVAAIDQNGATGTCLVSIRVLDSNDNAPIFYPAHYNITVREGYKPNGPLVVLSATDDDEGTFGEVHFYLKTGESSFFEVNEKTGEVLLKKGLPRGKHQLTVQAKDGSGSVSEEPAVIYVYAINSDASAPSFTQPSYVIKTAEDILPGISIGSVQATGPGKIRYSIYSGDPDHQFMIHPDAGRITVARYLDADKHDRVTLNVQAQLEGGGSNHTQVVILIEDHNDNTPRFAINLVEVTVSENQTLHEPFYIVHATDKDKRKNGAISYSIISSHPSCPVMVQPHTGQLQLTDSLDFEEVKDYRIRIKAQDHGIPPRSTNMTLILHVSDFNDNAPAFEERSYSAEIPENSPPMTTVLKVKARDADSRENGRVLYRITNGSSAFAIDEKTGVIYVNEHIDREVRSLYSLTVTAQDQGEPSLSSSVKVQIHITDVNDNAPSCASLAAMLVPVDSTPAATVGTVVIHDPDNGPNGTVVYRSQQSHPLFIVKSNGDVQLRRPLFESDPTDVRLSVIASDQGTPRKSTVCYVQIRIGRGTSSVKVVEPFERNIRLPSNCSSSCLILQLNATGVSKWQIQSNDVSNYFTITAGKLFISSHPPSPPPWLISLILSDKEGRQKHLSIRVLESNSTISLEPVKLSPLLSIGSKVANLVAKSQKSRKMYYSLKNESSFFELDRATGDIYLVRKIRQLQGRRVSLHYTQIDASTSESNEGQIDFEVGSGSVDAPYFNDDIMRVTVSEDAVIGTIVASVNATSSDPSAVIGYRLAEPNNRFTIDQYSGDVTVIEDLDWKDSPHHLVVVASAGGTKASMLLVVEVLDVNNNHPEIISSSDVLTTAEPGRVIHHVVAVDDDYGRNATVSYEIISDLSNCFGIDQKTGSLTMHRRPQSSETTIVVRASDEGSPALFADQTLTIRVTNGSERWSYFEESELRVTISDATPVGSIVATLPVDGKAAIRLFPVSSTFKIDDYGNVSLLSPIIAGIHQFSVLAKSPLGDIDSLSVVVEATPSQRQGPRISSASCGSITLPENRALKNFKQIVALNASSEANYSIRGASKHFEIHPVTGRMSCPALDREKQSEHLLVVEVQDGSKKDSCTVRITVADENDNAPQFVSSTPQVITINDSAAIRDVVYKFSAFDYDAGKNGKVLFDLVEDSSFAFDLVPESGELVFAREPERVGKDWMIRVKVHDKGVPSLSVDRFVRIQNARSTPKVHDTQPSFLRQKYVTSIDEGLTRGQIVGQVATSSRDARITYSIVEGNTDNAFEIDSDGVVRTSQELDYEIMDHYSLKIIGTGAFPNQIRMEMIVDVNNVNDNPPVFPRQNRKKVLETLPVGSYITTMSANDADNIGVLEYSMDLSEKRFVIDRFTGVVHLATSLDFETVEEISVDVKVTDGNFSAATTLSLVVMDVNDNVPEFQQRFVDIKVQQSTGAEEVIAKLVALDRDSGDSGRISYSLLESYELFHLDDNDGTLTLLSPLPANAEFLLTVTASDHGVPVLSSSIPVRVSVTKQETLHRPHFPSSSYEFTVAESLNPHIAFGNVSVSREPCFYRIMDSRASELFHIDQLGRLSVKVPLDREIKDYYTFTVDVGFHSASYHQNSTATVIVHVTDINDNSPVFTQPQNVAIRDGMQNGEILQRIAATDIDDGENGRISYRILSGDDYGIFSIDTDTGALMFNQWDDEQLAQHSDGKWILFIEARDHGSRRKSTILPVQVSLQLQTWSGSAPFFVVPSYVVPILETAERDSVVFTARATNRFGIPMKTIRYNLKDSDQTFSIDSNSGAIHLKRDLDYESKTSYKMSLMASDENGRSAVVSLEFDVLPVDEYPPVFSQTSYTFQVPLDGEVGSIIGEVQAVDADGGVHGIPEYRIETPNILVSVEKRTGILTLLMKPDKRRNHTIDQITVIAASSESQQTKATVFLEIGEFPLRTANSTFSSNIFKIGAAATAMLFLLLICLLGCCLFGYRTSKPKEVESPHKQVYSISRTQARKENNGICNLPRSPKHALPSNISQQASSMNSSASSNSGLRNSLLSHREAASTRSQPDSGIDQDTVSVNSSVTEYLISIGVNPNPIQSRPRFRRLDTIDSALNDYIYARVEDILPPGPVSLSENVDQLEGLYQYTQSRHAVPTFQPLTEIFDELEEIQREQGKKREYIQVEI